MASPLRHAARRALPSWSTAAFTAAAPHRALSTASSSTGRAAKTDHYGTSSDEEKFGFSSVGAGDKERLVKGVFTSVADNYDVMNDLMSAGMHRLWKDDFVAMIGLQAALAARSGAASARYPDAGEASASSSPPTPEPLRVLDVAGGTGDIAFRIIDTLERSGALKTNSAGTRAEVVVSDINPDMLRVGQQRAGGRFSNETLERVSWQEANAERLPFDDDTFDLYTIAFGLRNVTDTDAALRDAYRVLKPGGRFMCLEFSKVGKEPLQSMYDAYSFNVIPAIGQIVAGDRSSYQYLVESIRTFPKQEDLKAKMQAAGFKHSSYTNYTGGVVAVHSGFKL